MIRGAEAGAGTTGPPSTSAAAPSVNELHIRRVSTPATWGEARTSSIVTARWNWANGFREAWSNALTAADGDLAHRRARLGHEALRPCVVEPHQDAPGRVVVLVTPFVQVEPVLRRQAVLDPGDRLGAVARPHLLDAQRQDRAVLHGGRHGRQVQRRATSGARVVDVDDRRLVEPRLAQPALAAHAALVVQPPGHGVADDDEPELVRRHAGVVERLVCHLVGHGVGLEVAPAHVGHAGPEDGDVGRAHAGTRAQDVALGRRRRRAAGRSARRPASRRPSRRCGARRRRRSAPTRRHRSRVTPPRDGAERPWAAAGTGATATTHRGRAHRRRRRRRRTPPRRPRRRPAPGRRRPSPVGAPPGGLRTRRGPGRGGPSRRPRWRPAAGRRRSSRRTTTGRGPRPVLDVIGLRCARCARCAQARTQAGDAVVHEPAAAVEVHPGPLVLVRVAADAQAQDEAPAREPLERRRLLGDGRRPAQRELQHAGAQQGPGSSRRRRPPGSSAPRRWDGARTDDRPPTASRRRWPRPGGTARPAPVRCRCHRR